MRTHLAALIRLMLFWVNLGSASHLLATDLLVSHLTVAQLNLQETPLAVLIKDPKLEPKITNFG